MQYENRRILIWGKTYPELSWQHRETVCTGGCDEKGRPMRLYPVPLRYLPDGQQYRLYDWIEAPVASSTRDTRPESYRVKSDAIRIVRSSPATGTWAERRGVIYRDRSWHYGCVRDLEARQRAESTSLGFVKVGAVDEIYVEERTKDEREKHEQKLNQLKDQPDLFGYDQKDLEFFPYRVKAKWRCSRLTGPEACPGHNTTILDWGLGELARRDGIEVAEKRMRELAKLDVYDLHFFVGNFMAYPQSFGVVGVWYPKKKYLQQRDFFIDE